MCRYKRTKPLVNIAILLMLTRTEAKQDAAVQIAHHSAEASLLLLEPRGERPNQSHQSPIGCLLSHCCREMRWGGLHALYDDVPSAFCVFMSGDCLFPILFVCLCITRVLSCERLRSSAQLKLPTVQRVRTPEGPFSDWGHVWLRQSCSLRGCL